MILFLLFLAFVIAAAMRPGVELLARARIPRVVGVLIHFAVMAGVIALLIMIVVPRALDQVQQALGTQGVPTSTADLNKAANHSTGFGTSCWSRCSTA